jgi:type VI secretion system protein
MKLRFLKRLRSWEEAGAVSATDVDVTEAMTSVCDDLEKLFNTRRGTVLIDPEFGLPDFTHLRIGYSGMNVEDIERNLTNQARKYEKRLSSINLVQQEQGRGATGLRFVLNALFEHKKQELSLTANVLFNENGSISVSL